MTPYIVLGAIVLVVIVLFLIGAIRMSKDPGPPRPLDPETRAQLRAMQIRGQRRGDATDGSPVGGGSRAA